MMREYVQDLRDQLGLDISEADYDLVAVSLIELGLTLPQLEAMSESELAVRLAGEEIPADLIAEEGGFKAIASRIKGAVSKIKTHIARKRLGHHVKKFRQYSREAEAHGKNTSKGAKAWAKAVHHGEKAGPIIHHHVQRTAAKRLVSKANRLQAKSRRFSVEPMEMPDKDEISQKKKKRRPKPAKRGEKKRRSSDTEVDVAPTYVKPRPRTDTVSDRPKG